MYHRKSLTIEATGDRGKIEALLRVLEPFGIREIVPIGNGVAVPRSAQNRRPPR